MQNLLGELQSADIEFLNHIGSEAKPFDSFVIRASNRARAERLLSRGIVQVSGLTPSDAAHALGLQSQWSRVGARLACLLIGRSYGLISWDADNIEAEIDAFAQSIVDAMIGKSAHLVINQLSGIEFAADNPLTHTITFGNSRLNDLSISLKSNIPIVAVGGPAPVFYPAVGERLNVQSVIPQHADVANAIGAAIGRIKIRAVVEITNTESGGYHLHHQEKPLFCITSAEALEQAKALASNYVIDKAKTMGGLNPEVEIKVQRVDLPNMDAERSLIAATVIAECLSNPAD